MESNAEQPQGGGGEAEPRQAAGGRARKAQHRPWKGYWSSPVLQYAVDEITGKLVVTTVTKNVTYTGLPYETHSNCAFDAKSYPYGWGQTGMTLSACEAITLPDGSFLTTAIVCWDSAVTLAAYGGTSPASLVTFRSTDGFDWKFSSIIANASWYYQPGEKAPPFPKDPAQPGVTTRGGWINQSIQYGPNENALVLLADGRTIMSVVRMDANSECGARRSGVWPPSTSHSYQYYHQAFSTDFGKSFSMPRPITTGNGTGAGCVRPHLLLLRPGGPLLMSGGRNCVDSHVDISLWVSADGMGRRWEEVSVTGVHNELWPSNDGYRYTDRVNHSSIFAETTSYTSLLAYDNGSALLLYDRVWPAPGWVDGKPDKENAAGGASP